MVGDAITRAKELDDFFSKNGRLIGPLHGVPISTKVFSNPPFQG